MFLLMSWAIAWQKIWVISKSFSRLSERPICSAFGSLSSESGSLSTVSSNQFLAIDLFVVLTPSVLCSGFPLPSSGFPLPRVAAAGVAAARGRSNPAPIFFLSLLSAVNLLSSCYLAPIHVLSASFPPPVRLLRILPPRPFQTKTLSFWKFLKPVILNYYLNFKQFERSFFLNVKKSLKRLNV